MKTYDRVMQLRYGEKCRGSPTKSQAALSIGARSARANSDSVSVRVLSAKPVPTFDHGAKDHAQDIESHAAVKFCPASGQ